MSFRKHSILEIIRIVRFSGSVRDIKDSLVQLNQRVTENAKRSQDQIKEINKRLEDLESRMDDMPSWECT